MASTTLILPNYIVLRSIDNNNLSYLREGGETDGYLNFMEYEAVNPYVKFQVELSKTDGLVHIRSCQNNKYWTRTKNPSISGGKPNEEYWITVTAKEKEEDQSKDSCTLFEFISVDFAKNTVRIKHVLSECYLAVWPSSNPTRCVLANYKVQDGQSLDIFTMIDWTSLLILPKHVAFKGDNGKYLRLLPIAGFQNMIFASEDIGESVVVYEIIHIDDRNVCIKQTYSNRFWRAGALPYVVYADADDTSSKDTFFHPVKINDNTIGLMSLKNNMFCNRSFDTDDLQATSPSITKEAQLTVEEPVLSREIYGFQYDVDNARIYDESVLIVAQNSVDNHNQESEALSVKLTYTDIKTRTWNDAFSLKLGVKASMEVEVPLITKEGIEISTEIQTGFEWGEAKESSAAVEVGHDVVAHPMTKVIVNLVATQGKCDIPLSYIQKDIFYDGTVVRTKVLGAYFKGANYYNFTYDDKEEPLPPK